MHIKPLYRFAGGCETRDVKIAAVEYGLTAGAVHFGHTDVCGQVRFLFRSRAGAACLQSFQAGRVRTGI